ncbi:hypothetical protein BJ138DRAFT_1235525 [Hygrophoropsis aurantiaca]|uniref:Uncharacterized protein n=1 Tax=Hygrophoropsis aurantiaca TaxID=72124 RepID=A0ACB7ZU76_9AGAM|nr:hypothetical protein BJ138DRAFT_1235525 [Hygrophoropsis aurantiaca]
MRKRRAHFSVPGVSKGVKIYTGQSRSAQTLRPNGLEQRQQAAHEERVAAIQRLDFRQRAALDNSNHGPFSQDLGPTSDDGDASGAVDFEGALAPPGEEGFAVSHEGGEFNLYSELNELLAVRPTSQRVDDRIRSNRIAKAAMDWQVQYEDLTTTLLEYEHDPLVPLVSSADEISTQDTFPMLVVDVFERNILHFRRTSSRINECLLRHGCIGASPIQPTVAITVRTLQLYRETHRVCPRFSIHAEAKKLCRMHNVPYHRYLAEQFRVAFDVYLELHRRIDSRIRTALHQDTPNWRMLNSCPACQYKVTNEPPLRFSFLAAMDGNNSLKLVDSLLRSGKERYDPRSGQSDIWLSEEYVDHFKDEVRASRNPRQPTGAPDRPSDQESGNDPNPEWTDLIEDQDSAEPTDVCVSRWRNASPEARKKMFAIFRKSGVFVVVCRHGFLLTICDMVRSGELMKYPLASINKLLEVCGPDICIGYDIKCRFWQILSRSSIGPLARRLNISGVVQAFHGAGKEDFETCERTFSESNALAPETRFASEFHRHQAIDEHFVFADEEKYAALSKFIYNNYRQALSAIATAETFLNQRHQVTGMKPEDYESDLEEEREYLKKMHRTQPEGSVEVDYVVALQELEEAEAAYASARTALRNLDHAIIVRGITGNEITNVNRRVTKTFSKVELKMGRVQDLEQHLNIEARWSSSHPERRKAEARITHRHFYKACDDVERLIVMRLLEMTKLQASGLGYKLRTQIAKALQTRATAIRNALERYNKYGAALDPPVAKLTFDNVLEYTFLSEFDLIRHNDSDIHQKRWAHSTARQDAVQYFDLLRSREEIQRCNVEILRLLTKMADDEIDFPHTIATLENESLALASELEKRWERLRAVNAMHLARIQQIQALPGYLGPYLPGVRVGRQPLDGLSPLTTLANYAGFNYERVDDDQGVGDDDHNLLGELLENAHVDN